MGLVLNVYAHTIIFFTIVVKPSEQNWNYFSVNCKLPLPEKVILKNNFVGL